MKSGLIAAALVFVATSAASQQMHHSSAIMKTGQSQFAAIAEIVAVLRADPATDWAQVDIDALRTHLVDMDNVTMQAAVEQSVNALSVTFIVTGDADVAPSNKRMVLAHGPMLQQATGWSVAASESADGATMVIRLKTQDEVNQVTGLGFFGVMTVGAHHQDHHLLIASGNSPH